MCIDVVFNQILKVCKMMIFRGVKIVHPLPVTEGHKFNLAKWSTW